MSFVVGFDTVAISILMFMLSLVVVLKGLGEGSSGSRTVGEVVGQLVGW